jgi:SAM-dependent methyltransferase
MDDKAWQMFGEIESSGAWELLVRDGCMVPTRRIDPASDESVRLCARHAGWRNFVEHERIPVFTYPYEWTVSMMADAALLTLRIQHDILEKGLSLKDATAFNISFRGPCPVFIDINSIERPARLDVWVGYSQFCRMFLYPLLAFVHKGVPLKQAFLADPEGMDVERVYALFGRWRALCPDLLLDVFAQHAFSGKRAGSVPALRSELHRPDTQAAPQLYNLDRLARKIRGLAARYRPGAAWTTYDRTHTYTAEAKTEKGLFVDQFLREARPLTVLDLGCNQGTYSVMAAAAGARVIAVDADHDCVECLYRRARDEKLSITPMVVNLTNPSPGIGFRNVERLPFLDRVKADAVLALALVHHLLVTARLPLTAIRDLFWDLTDDYLVVEFIGREDTMFQELLALREDMYQGLSVEQFVQLFSERFHVLRRQDLADSHRHIFVMRKK